MGVRGLMSLFQNNEELLPYFALRDTRVVIDGDNLIYYLHFISSCMSGNRDHVFGGTYKFFGNTVRSFFNNLSRCNVEPIVVMDGGCYTSDVKKVTTIQRLTNRLRQCRSVSKRGSANFALLPMLSKSTFKDIVVELKITLLQSTFEADNEIVMIANHYECPVISNDSDFFVFDVKAGVIPLKTLNFSVVKEMMSMEGRHYFIDCNCYNINLLLHHFPGLDKKLLPLFSCLIGNDYTDQTNFAKMLNSLPNAETKLRIRKLRVANKQEKKMLQLLDWMRYKEKSEVISSLLRFLKVGERESAIQEINSVLSVYENSEISSLLGVVTEDENYTPLSSRLNLPVWFLQEFNCARIDSSAMNVATMNRLILLAQVEDFSLPSCYDCSLKLQKFYFQLLRLCQDQTEFTVFGRDTSGFCKKTVNVNVDGVCIHTLQQLCGDGNMLLLKLIDKCPASFNSTLSDLKCYSSDINICVSYEELNCLIHLIDFWLQEVKKSSQVYSEFVIALIASVVYSVFANSKKRNKHPEYRTVKSAFEKFLHPFVPNNGNKFESRIVHFYNELQAIIQFFTRINGLLNSPLPHLRIEFVLDGILIYNLTSELLSKQNPLLFILQKFGLETKLSSLFKFVYHFITNAKVIERKQKNLSTQRKLKATKIHRKIEIETCSRFAVLEIENANLQQ